MARVIDVRSCSPSNMPFTRDLCTNIGCTAFFVDTNVLIDFKDPLGRALEKRDIQRQELIANAISALKSNGILSFSTLTVAIEYYKHLQVSFYQTYFNQKFTTPNFKQLRDNDVGFADGWNKHIKKFKEVFGRKFPIYGEIKTNVAIADMTEEVDFGDFALYDAVRSLSPPHRFIFSNDSDFYSFSEITLLTINPNVIEKAREEDKLFVLQR
jgi:hypothetical protein